MTVTQLQLARKIALRDLKVGDLVRVVRVDHDYAGPGTGTVLKTALVVKVLADTVRVAWSEDGKRTTDFSRDSGKKLRDRRWINYPVLDVIAAPTVGPAF